MSDHLLSRRFARPRRGHPDELCAERATLDDAVLVVVSGRLNAAGVPRLDEALRHAAASPGVVILDLRAVSLVDLAGALLIVRADLWIRAALRRACGGTMEFPSVIATVGGPLRTPSSSRGGPVPAMWRQAAVRRQLVLRD